MFGESAARSCIFWTVNPFLLAAAVIAGAQAAQPTTIPEMWGAWCARCHAQDGSGKIDEPTVTVEPMDFTDCKLTTR